MERVHATDVRTVSIQSATGRPIGPQQQRPSRRRGTTFGISAALALTTLLSGCGHLFPQDGQSARDASSLRGAAAGAPPGKATYWLGPTFHAARVGNSSAGQWLEQASVDYSTGDTHGQATLIVSVVSYAAAAPRQPHPEARTRVHLPNGQDVVVSFTVPRTPSRALLRDAREAVQRIPRDVIYPG